MGKKSKMHGWPEAKKLCRLNQDDITMAKALGFGPDALIRAIPHPKQRWKLPVKYWIRDLHNQRFGHVLGEKPPLAPLPAEVEYDADAVRIYGEQLYWEDYWDRNEDSGTGSAKPAIQPKDPLPDIPDNMKLTDEDVPF